MRINTNTSFRRIIINPKQIAKKLGFIYSDEQMKNLENSKDCFENIKPRQNSIIIPTPPYPVNLLSIKTSYPELFCQMSKIHQNTENTFLENELLPTAKWMLVNLDTIPGSIPKNILDQKKLVKEHESIPTAVEIIYAIIVCGKVLNLNLFDGVLTRTISKTHEGEHLVLGTCNIHGLKIYSFWGAIASPHVCIKTVCMA